MELKNLFERELVDIVIRTNGETSYTDERTLIAVLTKITGKLAKSITIPSVTKAYRNIHSRPTKEDSEKLTSLYEGIISEYNLNSVLGYLCDVKGEDNYNPNFSGYTKNSSLGNRDLLRFGEGGIICCVMYDGFYSCPVISNIIYTPDTEYIARDIWIKYSERCYEVVKDHEKDITKSYEVTTVLVGSNGEYEPVKTSIYPTVSLVSPDFIDNYNKDFPESRISEFLEMDKGGIMIFNGHPGCGKSTYLKSLIFKNTDIDFIILPQYLLLSQESFRNFLYRISCGFREKDCVFIVEDCEQLLIQRENNSVTLSSVISDILNYTDGIFGDLTRTKFIFTFNTDLNNIDKAILRPGRLFLKYEFCPLVGENLEKLATKLGYTLSDEEKRNGIPLAELYSKTKTKDLVVGVRQKKRVGFLNYEKEPEPDEDIKLISRMR